MASKNSPRVALLGCGYWGKNLARVLHHLDCLALICDPGPGARAAAAQSAPGVPVVDTVEPAWEPAIDAVVVATPAATHFHLARLALEAGKDVLVEKPLALTVAEGRRLVRLADQQQRILMVGHVLEYHPAVVRLRELVQSRVLGDLYYLDCRRFNLGKIRREENILWSFAPHDVAVVLRLLGGLPAAVLACGGSYLRPNIPDTTVTHLLFPGGVQAHLHVSWLHPFKEQQLVVIGSRQMASLNDVAKKLILYDRRVDWRGEEPVPFFGEQSEVAFAAAEPLQLECEAFLASVRTRQPPLTDGASALRVLQVLEAAQLSLATHQSVPLSAEEVVP